MYDSAPRSHASAPSIAARLSTDRPRVLVVDDDARLLRALRRGLSLRGFAVDQAQDADSALALIDEGAPDLVVLDIMMPGTDGLAACALIRERSGIPVLMLTARDSVPDRVAGLHAGADDYLTKPFALEELVARLNALLRRSRAGGGGGNGVLSYADVILDRDSWRATRGGEPLTLTVKEFSILCLLLANPEKVVTREAILAAIWNDDSLLESNVVDVHVANLRRKLELGGGPRLVQTVRGVGYILREE